MVIGHNYLIPFRVGDRKCCCVFVQILEFKLYDLFRIPKYFHFSVGPASLRRKRRIDHPPPNLEYFKNISYTTNCV